MKDIPREEVRPKVQQCIYIFSRCDVNTANRLRIQLTSKLSGKLGKVIEPPHKIVVHGEKPLT